MQLKNSSKKFDFNLILFIVGFLVFPIAIFFTVFSIFSINSNQPNSKEVISFPMDNIKVAIERIPDKEKEVDVEAKIEQSSIFAYSGPSISALSTIRTGHSEAGYNKSLNNKIEIKESDIWQPTDYKNGDIVRNTYVVQLGDTLWEIAEAHYGNGADWVKVLENNKSQIGFLENGEQALIFEGQIFSLP